MTPEQFKIFIEEDIPCALFHVSATDKDNQYGVRLDELILIDMLHQNPMALHHKSLSWFYDKFIEKSNDSKIELLDCIKNMMGVLDTPLGRSHNQGEFCDEVRNIGRKILEDNN